MCGPENWLLIDLFLFVTKMAAGRALLTYRLVLTFLRQVSTNTFLNRVRFNPQHLYGKLLSNNIDKSTQQIVGNLGYGRHVSAVTFIFPSLFYRVKKHSIVMR